MKVQSNLCSEEEMVGAASPKPLIYHEKVIFQMEDG